VARDTVPLSTLVFTSVVASPIAQGRKPRDAVEVVVDDHALSAAYDGEPLDRATVQATPQDAWFTDGTIAVLTCGCGDSGCSDFTVNVRREGSLVAWTLWNGRKVRFEAEPAIRSLRAALATQ
jgi:hypothetical protein